jgi:hypothetical protein
LAASGQRNAGNTKEGPFQFWPGAVHRRANVMAIWRLRCAIMAGMGCRVRRRTEFRLAGLSEPAISRDNERGGK